MLKPDYHSQQVIVGFLIINIYEKNIIKYMISIEKGQTNSVVFTLKEKSVLSNPTYIFVFTDDDTKIVKTFSMANTSNWIRRYDRFNLIEAGTQSEDLSNGIVSLNYGWGSYKVYETSFTQSVLTATTSGVILETGRYQVEGWSASYNNFTQNNVYL